MEFVIEKCDILLMKRRKWQISKELQFTEKGKPWNTWKLWNQHNQTSEDERKNKKRVCQTNEKASRNQNLCRLNPIKGINTLAVSFVRYFGPFLKEGRTSIKMDQRTRKLMTMVRPYIPERWYRLFCCQEKKEEKD